MSNNVHVLRTLHGSPQIILPNPYRMRVREEFYTCVIAINKASGSTPSLVHLSMNNQGKASYSVLYSNSVLDLLMLSKWCG